MVSVIASSVRKGNVLEKDGKLYLVMTAENIHPGKGTPVTHLEMRRISDGVKTSSGCAPPTASKRPLSSTQTFNYLYQDGDSTCSCSRRPSTSCMSARRGRRRARPYLTENMDVQLQTCSKARPSRSKFPSAPRLTVVDTEPVMKGQTASGSFKPALLSNGVKTMVPTHITTGTRVVVMTEDGAYVERAKD